MSKLFRAKEILIVRPVVTVCLSKLTKPHTHEGEFYGNHIVINRTTGKGKCEY